jgi:SAM-dependent methyltransferase
MQVSALRSISRCYRLGLRRPTRAFPVAFAPARPRVANRGITSSADGKGNRDLADAYMEVRDMLTDPSRLVRAVASGKAKGADPEWRRLEMFPVALKGGVKLQVVKYDERQAFTSNHVYAGADASASRGRRGRRAGADSSGTKSKGPTADEAADEALRCGFGNWRVETSDEVLQLRVTKSGEAMVSRSRSLLANASKAAGANVRSHDRQKQRLLDPSDPFLVHVGVSTKDGAAIKADRRDKYKQVEEFLRLVDAAVDGARQGGHMPVGTKERPTRLVDLGCGNAYLTFGAYALLKARRGQPLEVVGVDVKRQARETNGRVASALGWERDCVFVEGTIAGAELTFPTPRSHRGESSDPEVDIVLALHACDTATDEALVRAVRWNAPLTLVAPCCHHDLQVRLKDTRGTNGAHAPMLRHGILRERLGDLITDAFRAHVLRLLGHRVDVVEWIGGEHTPRNTMIRAVRTNSKAAPELWTEYDEMVATWGVTPWLAEALQPELAAAREEAMNDPVPLAADSEVVEKDSTD